MPTINYTTQPTGNSRSVVARWQNLTTGDDGQPIPFAQYTDKSVQVTGTFGGATVVFEGSNDGVTYAVLTDPQGNALNLTSPQIEMVAEATAWVRPRVTGGSTPSINVHLLLKE